MAAMQITYGGTQIAGPGATGPRGISVPGSQIVDDQPLFRSAAGAFISRGNKALPLSFSVLWPFNTRALAEQFMLTHFANLPASGDLVVVCGEGESVTYTYKQSGAVLEGTPEMTQIGTSVLVKYSFKGGLFVLQ